MQTIDVVILSYTKDEKFYSMTRHCIESLHASESNYKFKVHLVETSPTLELFNYKDIVHQIIHPNKPFNYNLYLNHALPYCDSEYVIIMNNDVLCHKGWFSTLTDSINVHQLDSASPKCPMWEAHRPYDDGVVFGFDSGVHFCGWCLVFKQDTLNHIMPLDETFSFWFQDNDLAQYLRCTNKKHALIASSLVTHLESQSHVLLDEKEKINHTYGLRQAFADKWGL
jgi:GT2 family glycosyltransferase